MPLVKIVTNVPRSRIPVDFLERMIPVMASAIDKPAEKCVCTISGDEPVCFGSDARSPGAVATLVSIGNLGQKENIKISKVLSEYVEKEIGVSPKRFFIAFHDQAPWAVGIEGTTAQGRDAKK